MPVRRGHHPATEIDGIQNRIVLGEEPFDKGSNAVKLSLGGRFAARSRLPSFDANDEESTRTTGIDRSAREQHELVPIADA